MVVVGRRVRRHARAAAKIGNLVPQQALDVLIELGEAVAPRFGGTFAVNHEVLKGDKGGPNGDFYYLAKRIRDPFFKQLRVEDDRVLVALNPAAQYSQVSCAILEPFIAKDAGERIRRFAAKLGKRADIRNERGDRYINNIFFGIYL